MANRPRCCACSGFLAPEDLERKACRPCESGVKGKLVSLAGASGLFARLVWVGPDALIPSQRHQGGGGGGTKVEAPAPVRLGPINLLGAGGVVHTLQRWVAAWYDQRGFRHPVWRGPQHFVMMVDPSGHKVGRPGQLDNAVTVLLNNLTWAAENRADFREFQRDVSRFVDQIESALDPTIQAPARIVVGRCPDLDEHDRRCNELLSADLGADFIRCRRCGSKWTQADWPRLSDAMRHPA